jgi:hypothetical protein
MPMAVFPRRRLYLQPTGEASASRRPTSLLAPWQLWVGVALGSPIPFLHGLSGLSGGGGLLSCHPEKKD